MKVALIITTYNWKEALECVLDSVLKQTELPDEVVIADDGSNDDTKQLIEEYKCKFPIPLIHCWQPDEGFQLSKSRNKAIAASTADYIVMIDGDMIIHRHFVADHKRAAKKGVFIQGSRVLLGERISNGILSKRVPVKLNFFSKDIKNRFNTLHLSLLCTLFSKTSNNLKRTRGCHLAFWRKDILKTNGFNEEFTGWGREDSEFTQRMLNNKINRIRLKFAAIAYHIYHNENSRNFLAANDSILNNTISKQLKYCSKGIKNYL